MDALTMEGGRLNLFKTFTLKWWQGSLFKLGMLALGNSFRDLQPHRSRTNWIEDVWGQIFIASTKRL